MKFLLDANIPSPSKEIIKKFNYETEHSREIEEKLQMSKSFFARKFQKLC